MNASLGRLDDPRGRENEFGNSSEGVVYLARYQVHCCSHMSTRTPEAQDVERRLPSILWWTAGSEQNDLYPREIHTHPAHAVVGPINMFTDTRCVEGISTILWKAQKVGIGPPSSPVRSGSVGAASNDPATVTPLCLHSGNPGLHFSEEYLPSPPHFCIQLAAITITPPARSVPTMIRSGESSVGVIPAPVEVHLLFVPRRLT